MTVLLLARPHDQLRDVLWDDYIVPVGRWLAGPSSSEHVLAESSGSSWEAALTVWFLLDALQAQRDRKPSDSCLDAELINNKVRVTGTWLVAQHDVGAPTRPHWEGVTWDTAVCLRTIARLLHEGYLGDEAGIVSRVCAPSLRWLCEAAAHWDEQITFPFGPSDLAQIVSTIVYLINTESTIINAAFPGNVDTARKAADRISTYLAKARDESVRAHLYSEGDDAQPTAPNTAFWGDFFQSAEVIEALAEYVSLCLNGERKDADDKGVNDCRQRAIDCLQYFESHQIDGRWGTHSDTCRALYAYLRVSSVLPDIGQEDHVVLKGLRWMCDDKQVFADGSFMHTMFISVFYAHALLEVYNEWRPATSSVIAVYDEAIWAAPVRSTPERAKRLALEVMVDEREKDLARTRQVLRRFVGSIAFLVINALTVVLLFVFHDAKFVESAGTVVAIFGIGLTIALAAGGAVAKWPLRGRVSGASNDDDQIP